MSLPPSVIGLISGLAVVIVGKAIDFILTHRRDELNQARILGELRAGVRHLDSRVTLMQECVEARLDAIEKKIDQAAKHSHHIHLARR